jgi:hypothetical protein
MESTEFLVTLEVLHNTRSVQVLVIPGNVDPKLRLDKDRHLAIIEVGTKSWTCVLPKNILWTQAVQVVRDVDHVSLRMTLEPFGPCESVLLQSKSREAPESVMPTLQHANNTLTCKSCGKIAIVSDSPFCKVFAVLQKKRFVSC